LLQWTAFALSLGLVATLFVGIGTRPAQGATWTVDDGGGADFTTIQAAIDASASGDTIHVKAGTYAESVLVWKANLKMIGQDRANTHIEGDPGSPAVRITSNGVLLQDFDITHPVPPGVAVLAGDCVEVLGNNVRVRRNLLRECGQDGVSVRNRNNATIERNEIWNNGWNGVRVCNSTDVQVIRNVVKDNGYEGGVDGFPGTLLSCTGVTSFHNVNGVFVRHSVRTRIQDNEVIRNRFIGVFVTGSSSATVIEGNAISENVDDGINLEQDPADADDPGAADDNPGFDDPAFPINSRIFRNRIYKNGHEGIHHYSGTGTQIDRNRVYDNCLGGIVFEPATGPNVKVSNNTVFRNGFYNLAVHCPMDPAVTLNPNLHGVGILTDGPNPLLIERNLIHDNRWAGIHVNRHSSLPAFIPHVLRRNHLLYNLGDGIKNGRPGVGVDGVLVEENLIARNSLHGVNITDSRHLFVVNNTIFGGGGQTPLQDDGIRVQGGMGLFLAGNQIRGHSVHGVHLRDAASIGSVWNEIRDNQGDGIRLHNVTFTIIVGSRVDDNSGSGLTVQNGSVGVLIASNNITGNGLQGVDFLASNFSSILANKITGNDLSGVHVSGSQNNTVTANDVTTNLGAGVALYGSVNHTVIFNNLIGNAGGDAFDDGANVWDLPGCGTPGNYYSDHPAPGDAGPNCPVPPPPPGDPPPPPDGLNDAPYPIAGGGNTDADSFAAPIPLITGA